MSIDVMRPDYELPDLRIVSSPAELKTLFHPLRGQLLDLLSERAATVAELAEAVGRPKSTVAYHVEVLAGAGLARVVRTRRVRAVEERFYGRTAKVFYVGTIRPQDLRLIPNHLTAAAAASAPAHAHDDLRAFRRHARISHDRVVAFWDRVMDLTREFSALPREGEQVYEFVVGLFPTEAPSLPARDASDPDLT